MSPKFNVSKSSEVCDFIDKYISRAIPKEEVSWKNLYFFYNSINTPRTVVNTKHVVFISQAT